MNKQEIELKRTNIIDLLNDDMYNTAMYKFKFLLNNLTIGDINENERVHIPLNR